MAAPVSLLEITTQITGGPTTAVNVWHVDKGASSATAAMASAGPALETFYSALKSFYWTGATIRVGTKVLDLSTTPPSYVSYVPNPIASTGTTRLPAQAAAVMSWRTSFASRSTRGRTFLGPLAQNATNSSVGDLVAGFVTAANTAGTSLINTLATANFHLVIYSRKLGTYSTVQSANMNTRPDTVRRRLGK